MPGFTLDLGHCIGLRHVTFIAIYDQDKNTVTLPLSELLSTLREHQLSTYGWSPSLIWMLRSVIPWS